MAEFHAIQVVCEAAVSLLRESYHPNLIEPNQDLLFRVYRTEDFKSHMTAGGQSLPLPRSRQRGTANAHADTSARCAAGRSDDAPPTPVKTYTFS